MSGEYYHRDILHNSLFNDFNTSLILTLIKISTFTSLILTLIKISTFKSVQPLRYSQGNTQSIFYVII